MDAIDAIWEYYHIENYPGIHLLSDLVLHLVHYEK